MPKVITYLNKETIQNLKELSEDYDKSLSKVTSELVEVGYKIKQQELQQPNIQNEKLLDLALKNIEYLLRILNICSEILKAVHNEPSELPGKSVDYILEEIKRQAQNVVEIKLRKNEIV